MRWKCRIKNPIFWANTILSILTPILAYYGLSAEQLDTWGEVFSLFWKAIQNPYVVSLIAVSLWNNIFNPTTNGIKD